MSDAAHPGDLPPEEFRRLAHRAADWMADYLAGVRDLPVFPDVAPGHLRSRLPAAAPDEPESMDAALDEFERLIVPGITHWNHPAFYAYFSVSGSAPGILGEMLASTLNVNHMVWRSSPAATELEEVTMAWLRDMVGLPDVFDGHINDTASTSTMYALAAARDRAWPDAREQGLFGRAPGRVYASEHTHSSVEKAVVALGMGRAAYRAIETDDAFRMRPDALRAAMEEDHAAGVLPVAVVPTLGTTSTTAIDPVADLTAVAREFGAWVHVDAAYGGPAAVLPEIRRLYAGWEDADSIVINPHKWLFTPIDCSALYVRDPAAMRRAFSLVPAYLETPESSEARNLMDYGVALGRRFRSLKLWFVMRAFGRAGIAARIRGQIEMARRLAARIDATPGWETVAPVPLALVVFRFAPHGADAAEADRLNQAVIDRVNASGRAFVGPTRLNGRTVVRLSIGNIKTTEADVAEAWELLQDAARAEVPSA